MKHFGRPWRNFAPAVLLGAVLGAVMMAPPGARAQAGGIAHLFGPSAPLLHSAAPGYLGVDAVDVDPRKMPALKLKAAAGAVITLIDHDAPAGQIGLRVNDVVIELNGQPVENAAGLRRILQEIPAGRTVSLEISRDGNVRTLAVELADRKAIEREVWKKMDDGEDGSGDGARLASGPASGPASGMGMMGGGGGRPSWRGFHFPFFAGSLNVGALVEPLTAQMAASLGVRGGLMVKQVTRRSEAAAAGLKAFDVILKVGPNNVTRMAEWERALRSNQGKPVEVTVLRDKKQQTLTLQVDSRRHSGQG